MKYCVAAVTAMPVVKPNMKAGFCTCSAQVIVGEYVGVIYESEGRLRFPYGLLLLLPK